MRCPYCGSKMIYPETRHKNFSAGKAVAGVVALGAIGAAAGFIGKDNQGYRCSACGTFSEQPMNMTTDFAINDAVRNAEKGDFAVYDELKKKYPNIETVYQSVGKNGNSANQNFDLLQEKKGEQDDNKKTDIKNSYSPGIFTKNCPVYVEKVIIKNMGGKDALSFLAWNISEKTLRSVYLKAKVFDDVGDEISTLSFAYQSLSIESGDNLPVDQEFDLGTDLAYKITFEVEKAGFTDDSIWRKNEDSTVFSLSEQAEISPENFPKYKYLKAFVKENSRLDDESSLFQPVFGEHFTQCICGFPINKNQVCSHCGMNEKTLQKAISYEELTALQNKTIKNLASSRSKATQKLLDAALDKQYGNATKLLKDDSINSFDKAIEIFLTLGDYKDSKEQIKIAQKSKEILEEKIAAKRIADEKAAKKEAERIRIEQEKIAEERRLAAEKAAKKRKTIIATVTSVAAIGIVFVVVLLLIILPSVRYNNAVKKFGKEYADLVKNAKIGDTIKFGKYEQDNNTTNGKEEIEWIVLEKDGMSMLLISKYALNFQPFNEQQTSITWKSCSLRKWMNGTFASDAFSSDEQKMIQNTTVTADKNSFYITQPDVDTTDKVFLLSINEANKYFGSNEERKCVPTDYAMAQDGGWASADDKDKIDGRGTCEWWLRSTDDHFRDGATRVYCDGEIDSSGQFCDVDLAIRPAMWINLK